MDTLLCRYHDMTYIMSLPAEEVVELLDKIWEKRQEEKAWQMWLMQYQRMTKKTFIPFSEFYKKATAVEVSKRSTEDILQEVEQIRKRAEAQRG